MNYSKDKKGVEIHLTDEQKKVIMEHTKNSNVPSLQIVDLDAQEVKQIASNLITAKSIVLCW